jgi:transcriptional regulator with XRE-family HTH domain
MAIAGGRSNTRRTGHSAALPGDTGEWEALLGSEIRSVRLDAGHDQAALAGLADVSLTSVKNLENGRGSTLRTLVRVLRALDRADWLTTLAPEPSVSPIDLVRSSSATPRRRVYRSRKRD